jgi:1-acyl-sn-glycerol-3-phosphate acyltransferase
MLYHIARFLIRISLLLFFRKRYMHRIRELYTDKPLLVCANHANSFLDAMLLMVLTRRTYHVVVRADVFNKPWANYLLRKFNLIPIYRMKDGIDQLGKNEETFNECIRVFENKGALIIFPEASCFSEKRLRRRREEWFPLRHRGAFGWDQL